MDDMASVGLQVDSRDVRNASGDLDRFAGAGERTQRRTSSSMKLIGGALAALGAVSWASGGIREARAYGAAMSEVSTLIEGTPALMKEIEAATRGASRQFGTSAQAQAKAYYQAVSGGAKAGAEATELLNTANKLAIAGVSDVASAVGILTSATNVYAESGLTAAEASDALFVAVRAGVTTIPELSSALGKVLPLAQKLGLSFDEVAAATAALTKGGINTAESVTGINAALTSIIGPSKQASDLAESLGLEFNSAALETKGFAQFMADAVEATGGSADAMRTLFGSTEATKVALALAGTAGADMALILEDMGNKAGATETAFGKMSDDMDQRLKVVSARFADLQIGVGQALLTVLVPVMEKAADAAQYFADAIPVEKIAAAAQAFMEWDGLGMLAAGLGAVAVAAGALAFPFIAAGVAASVAATYLFTNWDSLRERFPAITGAMIGAVDMAKAAWSGIKGAFADLAPAFDLATSAVSQVIAGDFAGAWVSAKAAVAVFADWFTGLDFSGFDWRALAPESISTAALDQFEASVRAAYDTALAFGTFMRDGLTEYFTTGFAALSASFDPIKESLGDAWAQVGPILTNFKTIGQELSALFAADATNEASVFAEAGKFMGMVAGGAFQAAGLILEGTARALETLTGALIGLLQGDVARVRSELFEFFNWMSGGMVQAATDAVMGVPVAFSNGMTAISTALAQIWESIKAEVASWPARMVGLGGDIIAGLVQGIKGKAGDVGGALVSAGKSAIDKFTGLFGIQSPSKRFKGYGVNTIEGMVLGIKSETGALVSQIIDTANQVVNAADQTLAQGFGSMVDYMIDGFKGGMSGLIDIFKNTLKTLAATAIKNKITIPLAAAFSGGGTAAAAGGGTAAAAGGAGGGGLLGGLVGSFGTGTGIAGLAGGAGFLGGVGNVLGGLASGGLAGGFGAIGTALGGATAGLGGLAMAAGAVAPPLLAVVAAFSFFRKRTKELDSGLKVTVDGLDTLVQTFRTIETKRFWGLSKKVRTRFTAASRETSDAVTNVVGGLQASVLASADALGIAGSTFDNFAHTLSVSTKGLSDEAAQKAIQDALLGMADAMAGMVGGLARFAIAGEGSAATLERLAQSLIVVNGWMGNFRMNLYDVSLAGGGAAAAFVQLFGSLENFNAVSQSYYQNFFTDAERIARATELLSIEMLALGIDTLPSTRAAFRALVDEADALGDSGLVASLMQLSPAFAEITAGADALGNSLRSLVNEDLFSTGQDYARALSRSSNSQLFTPRESDAELRAELRALNVSMERLVSTSEITAGNTGRGADAADDQLALQLEQTL